MFHSFTDKQIIRTCLAVVGKGCLAASFICCYLFSGELYPTIIRQVSCSFFLFFLFWRKSSLCTYIF